ncbi:MAG: methyltransferase domain-containing protein [Ignavibacteria bacterium]|nr:methyltransferase domain-containing protein [Ignavibacteria bacterium]
MIQEAILEHNMKAALTWGSGGINYDRISHSISDAIEHCVNRLNPLQGEKILDIATGTGWAARLLANRDAIVTGVDIGFELIEAAEKLSGDSKLIIDYEVGDAEALSFPDRSFDAVVSTFGVMFVNDPESAAAEMARVIKPGGRLGLTTWSPEGSIYELFKIMKQYQPTNGTPPPSPFLWGAKERILELLDPAFELKFETGVTYLREPDGTAVWNLFVESYGPTKMLAASLDDKQKKDLMEDFISFHESFKSDLGVAMPREYLVTIGTRRD